MRYEELTVENIVADWEYAQEWIRIVESGISDMFEYEIVNQLDEEKIEQLEKVKEAIHAVIDTGYIS